MVTDFRGWLHALLRLLLPHASTPWRDECFHSLHRQFERSFVPDGKHRHALTPGTNLGKLGRAALQQLSQAPRISRVLSALGYRASSPWPIVHDELSVQLSTPLGVRRGV